jgi:hypothetical protein
MLQAVSPLSPEGIPMKRSPLALAADCNRSIPRLDVLEDRGAPGDALLGALLGWGAVAASDAPPPAAESPSVLAREARLLADIDDPGAWPILMDSRPAIEPTGGTATTSEASSRPEQGLPDPADAHGAPVSRIVAEGQGNAASSASVPVTAPPGPGYPAPAFAAVAIVQHPPSALTAASFRPAATVNQAQVMNRLGGTGLSFERNVGQTASGVDYLAHTGSGTVFLTPTAAVFAMQPVEQAGSLLHGEQADSLLYKTAGWKPAPRQPGVALYMDIVGASPAGRAAGVNPLPGKVNYFIGNDPSKWHSNIPTFGRVEYPNIYPGISLAYYGGPGGLEYDFGVAPGADPSAIALRFEGAARVELDGQGDLVAHTAAGDLVQHAPVVYQEAGGQRQPVSCQFVLHSGEVTFDVGAYDKGRPLVIDPVVLGYSTYLGGSGDEQARGIAADASGSAYVTGETKSPDFPTTPGAFDPSYNSLDDVFVAKLSPDGSHLLYATFLGGNGEDQSGGLAVDGAGDAYLTGNTASADFPTTPGAFDTTYNGGGNTFDAFVTRLSPGGDYLGYSTFLGGPGSDEGRSIAVDAAGSAYVAGSAGIGFPVTRGAFDTQFKGVDGFVTKFNPAGSALVYSTFLGGSSVDNCWAVAVNGAGSAYVAGATKSSDFPTTPGAFQPAFGGGTYDGFVAELRPDGSALAYGTYLGGSGFDIARGIAVDASGSAYATGNADSADFPTTPGAFDTSANGSYDAFVAKLRPDGSALDYSTFLGGSDEDDGVGIAVDTAGAAWVTGDTKSRDFPTTPGALQSTFHGVFDGFVSKLDKAGSALPYSTYLGGSGGAEGEALALSRGGTVYVAGLAPSPGFPTTPGAFDTTYNGGQDAFVSALYPRRGREPGPAPGATP